MPMGLGMGMGLSRPVVSSGSSLGPELMQNGDCSSGTGWGLPTGAAIAAGKMTLTALTDVVENNGLADTLMVGATYRCVFTIESRSAGSVAWSQGLTGTARSTAGTFSEDIVATDTAANLDCVSAAMQLDNISVKQVF